jgi:uncharacterized membrane protein
MAGVAVASYLTWVALWGHGEPVCTGIGNCRLVQQSEYARVAGIPVALLGLAMYAVVFAIAALRLARPTLAPRMLAVWTFALSLGGVVYSAYLTWLELAVIDAVCEWCVVSTVLVAMLFACSLPDLRTEQPLPD